MTRELGVGVIGVGQMGSWHVEAWDRTPTARLIAVAEPSEVSARRSIRRRPIEWHADWRELLERDDIDAVSIAAPTERHAEIALSALDAGKHVLVEKPIAAELDDALRMAAVARMAARKLMVGHVERFNPAVAKIGELISDGRLGEIFRIQATRVGPLPLRIADAGVAIDLATHDLDVMQWVLGRDITRVYAEGKRFAHPTHEDMLSCLLRFGDDGPFGLLDVNWLTPEKRRELCVIGEAGMLVASYLTQDVWLTETAGSAKNWDTLSRLGGDVESSTVRFGLRRVEPLQAELAAFAQCVLDDTPEPVTAYDGCRALIAALAVRNSAENSRPVRLLGMPTAPTLVRTAEPVSAGA
jgi:UDP-N-acetylglucosamine 3-dehydrogenase